MSDRPMNTEGMNALRAAVVQRACMDYAMIKQGKGKYKKYTKAARKASEARIKAWFHSPAFMFWCDLDPDTILHQMDKNIRNGKILYAIFDDSSHSKLV